MNKPPFSIYYRVFSTSSVFYSDRAYRKKASRILASLLALFGALPSVVGLVCVCGSQAVGTPKPLLVSGRFRPERRR